MHIYIYVYVNMYCQCIVCYAQLVLNLDYYENNLNCLFIVLIPDCQCVDYVWCDCSLWCLSPCCMPVVLCCSSKGKGGALKGEVVKLPRLTQQG